MNQRTFRITALVLGVLVVLGASVDAASGGTVSQHVVNHLECVACAACEWVSSLL